MRKALRTIWRLLNTVGIAVWLVLAIAVLRTNSCRGSFDTTEWLDELLYRHWTRGHEKWDEWRQFREPSEIIAQYGFYPVLGLGAVLAATTVSPWIKRLAIRKYTDDRHCLLCDYDLTGNVSGICPECGAAIGVARATTINYALLGLPLLLSFIMSATEHHSLGTTWHAVGLIAACLSVWFGVVCLAVPVLPTRRTTRLFAAIILIIGGFLAIQVNTMPPQARE